MPLGVQASDDQNVVMEEMVVTATREWEEVRRVPAHVTVITDQDIAASGATTLIEVLDRVEGVHFRDYSGNSSQAMIDVRGFGGDNPFGKTVVLLNGRRLNRPDMSSINWLQVPLSQVERIEVVQGAGGVLYGDGAVAGVINIITKKGKGKPTGEAMVVLGAYGLHEERLGVSGKAGKFSYAVSGDNRFSFGYRARSKTSFQGGGVNFGYDFSPTFRANVDATYAQNRYQLPGALTKAEMAQSRRQYQPGHNNDDGEDRDGGVNVRLEKDLGAAGFLSLQLLYGERDVETNMDPWWYWTDTRTVNWGISPQYTWEKGIAAGYVNKLTLGLDYRNEPYEKDLYSDRARTKKKAWADMGKESWGYYVRDEITLADRVIVTGGYRTERARIDGSYEDTVTPANSFHDEERVYHAEAWEAGITYLLGKKSKVFTRYSQVYRIPFLDEVASITGYSGWKFLRSLDKEKGKSWDIGMEVRPGEKVKVGVTAYRIDMSDEITYVESFPTGYNQNIGKSRHSGVEVTASWEPVKLIKLYGNATYQKAIFEEGPYSKKEIPLVPNYLVNAGVEVRLPMGVTVRPEVRYVSSAYLSQDNANTGEKLGSYTLFDLYLDYRLRIWKVDTKAFLGLENIANVKYESSGIDGRPWSPNAYYPMPGTVFKSGLSCAF